jgi:hypothetical protein
LPAHTWRLVWSSRGRASIRVSHVSQRANPVSRYFVAFDEARGGGGNMADAGKQTRAGDVRPRRRPRAAPIGHLSVRNHGSSRTSSSAEQIERLVPEDFQDLLVLERLFGYMNVLVRQGMVQLLEGIKEVGQRDI